jgi:hypothetical protein
MDFFKLNNLKRFSENIIGEVEDFKLKIGSFSIRRYIIFKYPKLVQKVFEVCIPVEMNFSFVTDSFNYLAHSEKFEVVQEGQMVNEYEIIYNEPIKGEIKIEFIKITNEEVLSTIRRTVSFI